MNLGRNKVDYVQEKQSLKWTNKLHGTMNNGCRDNL